MSTDSPRRVVRLPLILAMPVKETPALAELLDRVIKTCPVHESMCDGIEVPVTITWAR